MAKRLAEMSSKVNGVLTANEDLKRQVRPKHIRLRAPVSDSLSIATLLLSPFSHFSHERRRFITQKNITYIVTLPLTVF